MLPGLWRDRWSILRNFWVWITERRKPSQSLQLRKNNKHYMMKDILNVDHKEENQSIFVVKEEQQILYDELQLWIKNLPWRKWTALNTMPGKMGSVPNNWDMVGMRSIDCWLKSGTRGYTLRMEYCCNMSKRRQDSVQTSEEIHYSVWHTRYSPK